MLQSIVLLVFPAAMAIAASTDLLTMTISNRLQIVLAAAFVLAAFLAGYDTTAFVTHFAAGSLVLVISFVLFCFGWIGGGDAKLVSVTALWLGFGQSLVDYLLVSTILGGVLTLFILYLRQKPVPHFLFNIKWIARLLDKDNGVPYGIALALGGLIIFPHTEWLMLAAR